MPLYSILLSWENFPLILEGVVLAYVLYCIGCCVYNIYFHPLCHFPGPKLAAATRIYPALYTMAGRRHHYDAWVHSKYGEIVRTAPGQLSFIHDQAWRDIFTHRHGSQQLQKTLPARKMNGAYSIINAPDDIHCRQRKVLSHAFSERALREQEPLLKTYVDLLISAMRDDAAARRPVDIVRYFHFLTFDLIGDLAFASPFGALRERREHPWMQTFFRGVRIGTIALQLMTIPPFGLLLTLLSRPLIEMEMVQFRYTQEKVTKRLEQGSDRPDFMGAVLMHNERAEKGEEISRGEIDATFNILVIAGSETTATLLSGCMVLLQKNAAVLETLKKEVRSAFNDDDEITVTKVNQLPYLLAVLEESLRYYPPVPTALGRRTPPEGASICGQRIPGNTSVGIPQLAANRSPLNFVDPDKFLPERFLPDRHARFEKDRRAALQPFSAGPRNCLGRSLAYAEMKLILARIIYNFDLELVNQKNDWFDQNTYILWDKKPLMVRVTEREA